MVRRRSIPAQVQKRLFQECGSACCICGEHDIRALEIHHIEGDPSRHHESDMIVLCANCHAKAERGGIPKEALYEAKMTRQTQQPGSSHRPAPPLRIVGSNNIAAGRDLTVGTISIRTARSNVRSPVMPGTVAERPHMANYLNYLVDRYNKFKDWDCERSGQPRKPALIRVAYKRELGCTVKDTPVEQFERACAFLQRRIDNTVLGRLQRKRGQSVYTPFNRWLADKGLADRPDGS